MGASFRFGVLSTARIGWEKVIPELMQSSDIEVTAIASRNGARAQAVADQLGIPKVYITYEDLLADPDIDAIYNPLPNHLHVPWSVRAAAAGKHVLCEKPAAPTYHEALPLLKAASDYNVLIQEAFMVLTHPQWIQTQQWIRAGKIGELRAIQGTFSYFNRDPTNIRNQAAIGGGGLLDIGCYPIVISRFVTGQEPKRVGAMLDIDPEFQTDRVGTIMMQFPPGEAGFAVQSSFIVSTQISAFQRMSFLGTEGRLEVTIPFNPSADIRTEIWFDDGSSAPYALPTCHYLPPCGQYRLAGEAFARAARGQAPAAMPLAMTLANMAVIDAAFLSAKSGRWERPVRV